ncbi:MAG: hypothetical protein BWK80_15050 [Desulfobacteraceae bacterium IS3]|nr:MAG: hypothetical protein BWK80_15050 [Desulfobacteraceae bacterium IS3]
MASVNCECGFVKNEIPDEHIGRRAKCPKCGKGVIVGKKKQAEIVPVQSPETEMPTSEKQQSTSENETHIAFVKCECGFVKDKISVAHIGKKSKCPKCGKIIVVEKEAEPEPLANQPPIAVVMPTPEPESLKQQRTLSEKISALIGSIFYLTALVCLGLWIFKDIPGMPLCMIIAIAIGTKLIKKGKGKIALDKDECLIIKSKVSYKRDFFGKDRKITSMYLGKVPTEMIITDKRIICDVKDEIENIIFKYDEISLHDQPNGFVLETKGGKKYSFYITKESERDDLIATIKEICFNKGANQKHIPAPRGSSNAESSRKKQDTPDEFAEKLVNFLKTTLFPEQRYIISKKIDAIVGIVFQGITFIFLGLWIFSDIPGMFLCMIGTNGLGLFLAEGQIFGSNKNIFSEGKFEKIINLKRLYILVSLLILITGIIFAGQSSNNYKKTKALEIIEKEGDYDKDFVEKVKSLVMANTDKKERCIDIYERQVKTLEALAIIRKAIGTFSKLSPSAQKSLKDDQKVLERRERTTKVTEKMLKDLENKYCK